MTVKKANNLVMTAIALSLISGSVMGSNTDMTKTEQSTITVVSSPEQAATSAELMDYYSELNALDKARAKSWRLSEKEYSRYKLLKETTPRGIWTPNIDPITLLGVEARSEQERVKYARLFNQIELERANKDIAFGSAQNADLKRLSPNSNAFTSYLKQREIRRINYMNMSAMSQGSPESNSEYKTTSYIVYADLLKSCDDSCAKQIKEAIKFDRVDFYFLNAASDEQIYKFARFHDIPASKVQSGIFTLNYADEDKTPMLMNAVLVHKLSGNEDAVRVVL
jgi:integrating conjugative element protein (TIGR03759 family)